MTLTEKVIPFTYGAQCVIDKKYHQQIQELEDFQHRVVFDPTDYGLAIADDIDFATMDHRILQVFSRFFNDGYIHNNGDKCFFMSHLLRRILRLHGIEAHTRQAINFYANIDKGWKQIIGEPMGNLFGGRIDSHMVVVTKDYILDWSVIKPIHWAFGLKAPLAFIGKNSESSWDADQTFGDYGTVTWQRRRDHRDTKNLRFDIHDSILDFTKEYFNKYRM